MSENQEIQEISREDAINKSNRILFENDVVGVEHAFVSFNDGNKQAVLAFYTFKDGKILSVETGATNITK